VFLAFRVPRSHDLAHDVFWDAALPYCAAGCDQPLLANAPSWPLSGEVVPAFDLVGTPLQDVFQCYPLAVGHQQGVAIQTPV
jgi:hypothetical protein